MTTKVTVDAHAGWPVSVQAQDLGPDGEWRPGLKVIVDPKKVADFHVWDGHRVVIEEMKNEAAR